MGDFAAYFSLAAGAAVLGFLIGVVFGILIFAPPAHRGQGEGYKLPQMDGRRKRWTK